MFSGKEARSSQKKLLGWVDCQVLRALAGGRRQAGGPDWLWELLPDLGCPAL